MYIQRLVFLLAFCGLLAGAVPVRAWAQTEAASPTATARLHWREEQDGVRLEWSLGGDHDGPVALAAATAALAQLPLVAHAGYRLPLQIQLLALPDDVEFTYHIEFLATQPWTEPIQTAAPQVPPALAEGVPRIEVDQPPALPDTPLFVLREGRMRGQRLAVVALSLLYEEGGTTRLITRLTARLPGRPVSEQEILSAQLATPRTPVREARGASPAPANPAAWRQVVKIHASQPGLQRVGGVSLLEAGLGAGADLDKLHLRYEGEAVALEVRDGDGKLDPATELRFYAPPSPHSMQVGDRWNATAAYWLTLESTLGTRMAARTVTPGDAPVRTTALESGVWEDNRLYESTMPGVDGDHWFAAVLRALPAPAGAGAYEAAVAQVALETFLPLARTPDTTAVLTITGSTRTTGPHELAVGVGAVRTNLSWSSANHYQSWQQTLMVTEPATSIQLELLAGAVPRDIRLDKVYWQQPVTLDFGGKGAHFQGVAGVWRYTLTALPANGSLYDVTDPRQPQQLVLSWGAALTFEDGPAPRAYVVAGPGTVQTPAVSRHTPLSLPLSAGADVIYVAPDRFHAGLAPLAAHRQAAGYEVVVVDVQEVYDAWSFGQIDPEAIRSLLRHAVEKWSPAPIAAVLVGDATLDPHNYLGQNNLQLLPAYLAYVDPWLGEVACESCFAQLDGESPFDPNADAGFLPDIWLGRFSVQDEVQLSHVVNKILHYETAPAPGPYTSLSVADNYIQPTGEKDPAGDFAHFQDLVVVGDPDRQLPPLQSSRLPAVRLYYDPRPGGVTDPWREPDAVRARQRVIDAFQRGPRLVTYNGHANHFQWASTLRELPQPYLFGTNDIFLLHNWDNLSILLEMTCLTSQFVHVSASGTTIDERFHRHPEGGAVAVWGSAGYTLAYGQHALLQGFHGRLWREPLAQVRLGELVEAGYLALFATQSCCQETRWVYLLLGDPLTPALVWGGVRGGEPIYLPLVQR
ncbi:MAG: hypothetical protein DCC55_31580 [Chloroflexi bacterium]|nr:MAG: hypothetical protein DCC55_31580 [Chloroflexota bacterium]